MFLVTLFAPPHQSDFYGDIYILRGQQSCFGMAVHQQKWRVIGLKILAGCGEKQITASGNPALLAARRMGNQRLMTFMHAIKITNSATQPALAKRTCPHCPFLNFCHDSNASSVLRQTIDRQGIKLNPQIEISITLLVKLHAFAYTGTRTDWRPM